jgi:hypothetical protein
MITSEKVTNMESTEFPIVWEVECAGKKYCKEGYLPALPHAVCTALLFVRSQDDSETPAMKFVVKEIEWAEPVGYYSIILYEAPAQLKECFEKDPDWTPEH